MDDIRGLLKVAARRLEMTSYLGAMHCVAVVVAGLLLLLMLADKVPAAEFMPWPIIIPSAIGLTLAVAGVIWWTRRRSEIQVALAVDERLDLRERLSTALHCRGRDDVFAMAAVEDAVQTARDPRSREQVGRRFKVEGPRGWWISPMLVLLALLISFLPSQDLFAQDPDELASNITQTRAEVNESLDDLVKMIEEKPQLSQELSDLIGDLTKEGIDPDAMNSTKEIKRDALKKVTDLNKRLDELLNGEKNKTAEALDKTLQQLQTPEDGPAKELAEALANADFKAASKALEDMKKKLQNGELNEEQKKKLQEQLDKIGEQLEQLAQKQDQLEQALKQAGLDPQLAQNAEALQQAIQNNPNLNEQQKQQLQQMAQAQQAANQMCQGLGQAMKQMGQGMMNGKMGEGAGQMGQQLDQMEAMRMLLQEAKAAQSMCQGQCQGLGQGLAMQGGAFGNRGQGRGGKAPIAPTPSGTTDVKANINTTEGDIIARVLFDGPQVVGESHAKIKEVAAEATEGFDEALTEDQLPRRYHETQKHYFGELKKLTESKTVSDEEESSSSTTESTSTGESSGESTTSSSGN
jgi:hypothetical protein